MHVFAWRYRLIFVHLALEQANDLAMTCCRASYFMIDEELFTGLFVEWTIRTDMVDQG